MTFRNLAGGIVVVLMPSLALAQGQSTTAAPQQPAPVQQASAQKPEDQQDQKPVYEEQVVVTASKTEEKLVNAPATVSLVSTETIQQSPGTSYADLLRTVPGLNVSQTSARDINLTSRGATATLSTSQLALVDGRSLYLDFFGFVAWDFLPVNPNEIKQIEVIRGPASAIWGANAMTGVVNFISKSPRELKGDALTFGIGAFDRTVVGSTTPLDRGTLFYVNGTHAQVINDRWAYKLSAGTNSFDAFARPVGTINNAAHTPYSIVAFKNEGTKQPKVDARVDFDHPDGRQKWTFQGGVAGTQGIIHTGIGPFRMNSGSLLGYTQIRYTRGGTRVGFFSNLLDGDARNLLSVGPTGQPIDLIFKTQTYDFDFGDTRALNTKNVVSYGGTYRRVNFDLSIAPNGTNRNEGGGYFQDEIFFNDHLRWVVGARLDKFSSIEKAVFSPRTTFLVKPNADNTFRVSFNQAFRSPSQINNWLNTAIVNQIDLAPLVGSPRPVPYNFPVFAYGSTEYRKLNASAPELTQETLTAYEVGYTGVIAKRATISAAVYFNNTKNGIYFTQIGRYTALTPPPRWPLPAAVIELLYLQRGIQIPSTFSYRNLGRIRDKGFELGIDAAATESVNVFANYSYQATPDPDFDLSEINQPPKHRFNAGFNFAVERWTGNVQVSYTDGAFWQDVLDSRFAGPTEAYTLVNTGLGYRWAGDKLTTSLKITNLANQQVQQHVFGDITKRQIVAEARVQF